eukprot:12349277-Alexandrium_andersonii.AAC.1
MSSRLWPSGPVAAHWEDPEGQDLRAGALEATCFCSILVETAHERRLAVLRHAGASCGVDGQ